MNMTKSPTFEDACSFESLLGAYRRACRAGRYRREALEFGYRLESNLLALHRDLMQGTYRHGPYHEFTVVDAKKRKIKAACFRDRVVHQAVHHALEPLFEPGFISDSYACRKGKGTHAALRLLEVWLRRAPHLKYVLSCDISRYFASIDHELLLARIGKKLKDAQLRTLCRQIVESSSEAPHKGIPIGNLTSQLFANICLDEFDHYAKRALKCRHYVRYMDDFLILGEDASVLRAMKVQIAAYLDERLGLLLHPKKATVFRIANAIPFLGYRVFTYHRLLRKNTVMRFSRRVRNLKRLLSLGEKMPETFQAGLHSWAAYAEYAASCGLRRFLGRELAISFAPITSSPYLP